MAGRLLRGWVGAAFSGRALLLTNTLSSGGLLVLGDLLQQRSAGGPTDTNRSLRMLAVGLSQGPPHHYWYGRLLLSYCPAYLVLRRYLALDRLLPGKAAGVVARKILADQLLAAPFFAVTFVVGTKCTKCQIHKISNTQHIQLPFV
jgi:protein Mpv17